MKTPTYYMDTTPDGVIPASAHAGTPVSLADAVGQIIDHPNPCKQRWYDESAWSYFRMVKRVGEVLEDVEIWPVAWPVRLWIVEPIGEAGNWGQQHYPYRLLSHQVRVVEETEAWHALGRRGREVLDLIAHQIPDLARRWAADWAADPDSRRQRQETWRLCNSDRCTSGRHARVIADDAARRRRETAAKGWIEQLAAAAAKALPGADQDAVSYARTRASDLATAVQFEDRLSAYVLDALRGAELDTPVAAAA